MNDRQLLAARGRRLEYITILWNCLEGLLALVAAAMAGSVSLMGFGLDSFIEVTSGTAVLWRMSTDHDTELREQRERLALRIVGISFIALALYVVVEAMRDLIARAAPEASPLGIAVAGASLIAMPLLARAKRRTAAAMGSRAMHADAAQTDFCAYLSGILLAGLGLNAAFGLWWADPIAGLAMVPIMVSEGVKALRGDPCDCD